MSVGQLRFVRPGGYADILRRYRIFVNGRSVGRLAAGDILEVEVPVGRAIVEARLDWGGSQPLTVDIQPGRATQIEVSNNWGGLLALWAITFGHTSYLALKRV